ncbi:potassium/sodium hyperpolarization-activated cyclic nucleotide-gated channel 4-like [Tubulanus polymorphus]|uniref:potassium/sodium hyperpolarization-activated cyclic nucleotide-gated channel 4-like n=1 Tax=Tubulanus polymorphus TaxID=672921 RepID=UPI003DA5E093
MDDSDPKHVRQKIIDEINDSASRTTSRASSWHFNRALVSDSTADTAADLNNGPFSTSQICDVENNKKKLAPSKTKFVMPKLSELDIGSMVQNFETTANTFNQNPNLTEGEKLVNVALGLDSLKVTPDVSPGGGLLLPDGTQPAASAHSALILMVQSAADRMFHVSSINKVTKKIFRSDDAIEKEQQRQFAVNRFVIHPFSKFRWYWEMLLVVVLAVDLIILPIQIAFYNDGPSKEWDGIMLFFDVVFMVDIVINFRTGVMTETSSEVILNSKALAIHYLKTWFFIDLVSSVPFDKLYELFSGQSLGSSDSTAFLAFKVFRLVKLLSLLRVLRMARLLRYVQKLEEVSRIFSIFSAQFLNIQESFIRIINLVVFILLLSHWNGCMQYFVVAIENFPADSWVVRMNVMNGTIWEMYTLSVFKAMSHMLSIGYGRAPPVSVTDTWLTMASMLLGATFYALFIAHMSSLLIGIDYSGRLYNEKLAQVKEYMKFRHVPHLTKQRVLQYYEQKYQRKYFDENAILSQRSMSSGLRKEILLHNCQTLVEKVPFLARGPPEFIMDIIGHLKFEVFLTGDTIITAGATGRCMYFIEHGKVEVILPNGKVVNRLGDGYYFGEISLLMDERRVASVVAVENCDVFVLTRSAFNEILDEHPYMQEIMETVATERLEAIKQILEPSGFDSDEENEHVMNVAEHQASSISQQGGAISSSARATGYQGDIPRIDV